MFKQNKLLQAQGRTKILMSLLLTLVLVVGLMPSLSMATEVVQELQNTDNNTTAQEQIDANQTEAEAQKAESDQTEAEQQQADGYQKKWGGSTTTSWF